MSAVATAAIRTDAAKMINVSRQDICGVAVHEKAPPKRGKSFRK
jgi:hypothetical protein